MSNEALVNIEPKPVAPPATAPPAAATNENDSSAPKSEAEYRRAMKRLARLEKVPLIFGKEELY